MESSYMTEVERNRRKEEQRRQKEMSKALETPEQKRARRLAKKQEKERRRKKLMGWDDEYMGYTNDDNPFGDSNLHETFVWSKKYEKQGVKNIDEDRIRELNKQRMIRNRQELEKVKRARLEREREREERNEEISRMQRDREADQFKEWHQQEEYFQLKQAKLRSKLRIRDGRAKPIDLLARYITAFGDNELPSKQIAAAAAENDQQAPPRTDQDEEDLTDRIQALQAALAEPYNALNGLRIRDMEDLEADIRVYIELDSSTSINVDYWRDLLIIVDDELAKLKLANMDTQERRREGINPSVSAEIAKLLAGKTPAQLKTLQAQIERKIASKEEGIDIGYWETMLSRLRAQIARARLREFHDDNLRRRADLLRDYQKQLHELRPSAAAAAAAELDSIAANDAEEAEDDADEGTAEATEDYHFLSAIEIEQKCLQDYRSGGYSPKPLSISELNSDMLILTVEDRARELDEQRTATLKRLLAFPTPFVQFGGNSKDSRKDSQKGKKKSASKEDGVDGDASTAKEVDRNFDHNQRRMTREEEAFVREAKKGMNDDEAIFSVEEVLMDAAELQQHQQTRSGGSSSADGILPISAAAGTVLLKDKYSWAEKYRPRKPRYFNRVHTGFEWNKYNQTHYDVDNPPPKVVQGYKFNIFYPDLIEKSSTPSYKITPCADNRDFAYIRFTAGPPYEDICFKIVNREWNYSYKSGFRSQFQNNILQLWFHFKRYRYRR